MSIFIISFIVLGMAATAVLYSKLRLILKFFIITFFVFSSWLSFKLLNSYMGKPIDYTIPLENTVIYGFRLEGESISVLTEVENETVFLRFPFEVNLAVSLHNGRREFKGQPFTIRKERKNNNAGIAKIGESGSKYGRESVSYKIHELPPAKIAK